MSSAIDQRVRLRLLDPDAGYGSRPPAGGWPVLEGRLVAAVLGLYGKTWYLLKLDRPLPAGFDPLGGMPKQSRSEPIDYLFLSPAPAMPTIDVPPDFIGESLAQRRVTPVLVSIGAPPEGMPPAITLDDVPSLFPGLCSGKLEAIC